MGIKFQARIGVDDMFLIMNTVDVVSVGSVVDSTDTVFGGLRSAGQDLSETGIEERIGIAMRSCGMSVFATSVTDIVAFFFGLSCAFPGVRAFCLYASFCIFFDFLFQITFFLAVFAIDIRRQEARIRRRAFVKERARGEDLSPEMEMVLRAGSSAEKGRRLEGSSSTNGTSMVPFVINKDPPTIYLPTLRNLLQDEEEGSYGEGRRSGPGQAGGSAAAKTGGVVHEKASSSRSGGRPVEGSHSSVRVLQGQNDRGRGRSSSSSPRVLKVNLQQVVEQYQNSPRREGLDFTPRHTPTSASGARVDVAEHRADRAPANSEQGRDGTAPRTAGTGRTPDFTMSPRTLSTGQRQQSRPVYSKKSSKFSPRINPHKSLSPILRNPVTNPVTKPETHLKAHLTPTYVFSSFSAVQKRKWVLSGFVVGFRFSGGRGFF